MNEAAEQLMRSFARSRRLATETAALVARVRDTIADVRNRVYAIRLKRELNRRKKAGLVPGN